MVVALFATMAVLAVIPPADCRKPLICPSIYISTMCATATCVFLTLITTPAQRELLGQLALRVI